MLPSEDVPGPDVTGVDVNVLAGEMILFLISKHFLRYQLFLTLICFVH